MGIRFQTNTWRAPLQLIDCWLPIEQAPVPTQAIALPQSLQKFARAGWLKRRAAAAPTERHVPSPTRPSATVHRLDTHRRQVTQVTQNHNQSEARLVLSGRMDDVCAELDRLAAMELRAYG